MAAMQDPFRHHPELRDQITDPMTSFFRTFSVDAVLEKHPELEWVRPHFYSDAERENNRMQALDGYRDEDLWIFAYGSLMWDPALDFAEVRRARVPEYARRFILKDVYGGRGSRESPGLMAALDHGDGCEGLIFRIAREAIDVETEILWRREVIAPSYTPTFVPAILDGKSQQVLAFIADHQADQICGDITRQEQIDYLINGRGILGASLEYLENLVAQFDTLGIVDEDCSRLLAQAREECLARGQCSGEAVT